MKLLLELFKYSEFFVATQLPAGVSSLVAHLKDTIQSPRWSSARNCKRSLAFSSPSHSTHASYRCAMPASEHPLPDITRVFCFREKNYHLKKLNSFVFGVDSRFLTQLSDSCRWLWSQVSRKTRGNGSETCRAESSTYPLREIQPD